MRLMTNLSLGHHSWKQACFSGQGPTRGPWPRYELTRSVFLRALGLVYLAAFWSLAVQIDGLVGSRGVLPVREYLARAHQFLGPSCYWTLPTLLWLDPS